MFSRISRLLIVAALLAPLLSACGHLPGLSRTVTVTIVYGSEKREWLEPLVAAYNEARHRTADGAVVEVVATPMGSVESADAILAGTLQPTVWSPASSLYIPVINAAWRQRHAEDLVLGDPPKLVLSPVVIAMWRPMAEVLGWPDRPLGWADIAALATSPEGWSAYGYPEWGAFKFGHTHPHYSNSGLVAAIAIAYAGAGKQRGLTLQDLQSPAVRSFMLAVESSIIHYGVSTGFFAERMFERGPSYLSAAVLYENLVVAQESKRLAGQSLQLPVVAIYPKEGTFWSDHPYAILNAPWVTAEQRAAAEDFLRYLLDRPQQLRALELGFRPADPSIPLSAPLDALHGVDPSQPQTVLETPSAEVIAGVQALWRETKRPVDVVAVMDISGSMAGKRIAAARTSLMEFINVLGDRDRLQIILFSDGVYTLTPLSPVGEKRQEILRKVSAVTEGGKTCLYDAVYAAYQDLLKNGDPAHIRAIVVLSDGQDTASRMGLPELLSAIRAASEDGNAPKIFTIAFGDEADREVLRQIAETTGGKQYESDPQTIRQVYAEIATFF